MEQIRRRLLGVEVKITAPKGVLYAAGAALLFGCSTPFAKLLIHNAHPILLAGLLYAGSGIGLALVVGARALRRDTQTVWPHGKDLIWLLGATVFGGIFGPALLMFGLQESAASSASLLLNFEAVFTALLAWLVFKENCDRRIALGMALIVVGGLALSWSGEADQHFSSSSFFIVGACLCWAIDNNLTRKVSANDALVVACLKGLVAGLANITLAVVLGQSFPNTSTIAAAGTIGFLGYGLSLTLFVLALRYLGAARTGAYFSVAPFFGAALSFPLNGDPITAQFVMAAALMAGGVWLHLTENHGHVHSHEATTHTHEHTHDAHHQHDHAEGESTNGSHTHEHTHAPLTHDHAHYPDIHHQHRH